MDKPSGPKFLNDPQVRRSVTEPTATRTRTEMDKVRVIKHSLFCYNLSWLGLIPLLGLAPALIALLVHFRIRKEVGPEWNPARRYDVLGVTVAVCGLIISLVLWAIVLSQAWRVFV